MIIIFLNKVFILVLYLNELVERVNDYHLQNPGIAARVVFEWWYSSSFSQKSDKKIKKSFWNTYGCVGSFPRHVLKRGKPTRLDRYVSPSRERINGDRIQSVHRNQSDRIGSKHNDDDSGIRNVRTHHNCR